MPPSLAKFLIPKTPNPKQRLPLQPITHHINHTNHPSCNHTAIFDQLKFTSNTEEAAKLHGLLAVNGFLNQNNSPVLGAQLVNTYVCLGMVQEALVVFDHLPKRNSFAWNSILKGLADVGRFSEVIRTYHHLLEERILPDNFTYPIVLKACSRLCLLEEGRKVREHMESNRIRSGYEPNIFVQCAVIDMFAKCSSMEEARMVFDGMPVRDLVSWSAMICGTMQVGDWAEALTLFCRMRSEGLRSDSVVVATILPACGRLGDMGFGMVLQSLGIKSGLGEELCVLNALIDMYCKCGHTYLANNVFQGMKHKDVVTWSSLIAGYSQNHEHSNSLNLYAKMIESGVSPSSVTLASVLPCFAERKLLREGKGIHGYASRHGFELDAFVASALVDFYCQCGSLSEAEVIFEFKLEKEIAVWNSMMSGYALGGDIDSTFKLLRRIQDVSVKPNSVTVLTVLPLCAGFSMLRQGKELHGYIVRSGLSNAASVSNSLIDMYCKCGCLGIGRRVFYQMTNRNIITYNTIITAIGMHGNGDHAISYFDRMQIEQIRPDKVTFVAVLSACSHAGLIDKGLMLYKSMVNEHGILPEMEHFSCMVDLYSRSGCIDEAWEFIKKMPVEPNIDVLGSLLGACRVCKRTDLAEVVGKWIIDKEPEDPGYYILLSNIYADAGKRTDEANIRKLMKERGLTKNPGASWIQVGGSVHYFIAHGREHIMIDNIYDILVKFYFHMKDEVCVSFVSSLHDNAIEGNADLAYRIHLLNDTGVR